MELRREDFPITLQAYNVQGEAKEDFIAEQVVNSQGEADTFMTRFAGKLIRTREVRHETVKREMRKRRNAVPAWIIILSVLIILLVVAYATGWLQTVIAQIK